VDRGQSLWAVSMSMWILGRRAKKGYQGDAVDLGNCG